MGVEVNWRSKIVLVRYWLVVSFLCFVCSLLGSSPVEAGESSRLSKELKCTVKLALVICGDESSRDLHSDPERQINQTVALLKSILITTEECVQVFLITDKVGHFDRVKAQVLPGKLPQRFGGLLKLDFVELKYPPETSRLKGLFRPCATFPLFLSDALPNEDALIYSDTDFLFLRSIANLWSEFGKFSQRALAGMVPRVVGTPHYAGSSRKRGLPDGFNSGIILMNLTRMRGRGWTEKLLRIEKKYGRRLTLADQDILNIYFHKSPQEIHKLSCDWNFRYFQCNQNRTCPNLLKGGISAIHGLRKSFIQSNLDPLFPAIFKSFQKASLGGAVKFDLKEMIRKLKLEVEIQKKRGKGRNPSGCARMPQFGTHLLRRLQEKLGALKQTQFLVSPGDSRQPNNT